MSTGTPYRVELIEGPEYSLCVKTHVEHITAQFSAETPVSALLTWLDNHPAVTEKYPDPIRPAFAIRFSEDDGLLHLRLWNGQELSFDPHSEEDLAKLVRRLKTLAARNTSHTTQLSFPGFTLPSDLVPQVFNNPAPARGYRGQATHRAKPSNKPIATLADIDAAFADLFGPE